jgi:hypothetical protein
MKKISLKGAVHAVQAAKTLEARPQAENNKLIEAARDGNVTAVKALLDKGVDPNCSSKVRYFFTHMFLVGFEAF